MAGLGLIYSYNMLELQMYVGHQTIFQGSIKKIMTLNNLATF